MEKDNDLDLLIAELKEEHLEIERLIIEIDIVRNPELVLNDLGFHLEKHIRKEEKQLFERIQTRFQDDLDQLVGKINPVRNNCNIYVAK